MRIQNTYRDLPAVFYQSAHAFAVPNPEIVILNVPLMQAMNITLSAEDCALFFSGQALMEGSDPLAMAYAGHQFGHFTILGDGRALLLGEHVTPMGERFDIHLKGSGRTAYSRRGDGKAAMAPMLREYLISEAMHNLGIPTSRSLAVVKTGEIIQRDYPENGAILTRIASSHIRVGTFEYAAAKGDIDALRALMDYTIDRHYPQLKMTDNPALELLRAVMHQQITLINHWLRVGFIHGVMNTDNMAISGETIDYGPCAFMDAYDPETVFSAIDQGGRYAFGKQSSIAQWNLARFAESLLPLLHPEMPKAITIAEDIINQFPALFNEKWLHMMRQKLGLIRADAKDESLIQDLLLILKSHHIDYTNFFSALSHSNDSEHNNADLKQWMQNWQHRRINEDKAQSIEIMKQSNPVIIPRNHNVEAALKSAAQDHDLTDLTNLLNALSTPYQDTEEKQIYKAPPTATQRVYQTFCGT